MSASEKWNKLKEVPQDLKPVLRAAINYTEKAHQVWTGVDSIHYCRNYPCTAFNEDWTDLCRAFRDNTNGFRDKAIAEEMAHRLQDLFSAEKTLRTACREISS